MVDTSRTLETPEGVALSVRIAGPVPRVMAYGLDLALRMALYWLLSIPAVFLGELGVGLLLIAIFLAEWFFPVYFEVWRQGATPGKRVMKLHVVHRDGTAVGLSASVLRNLMRFADFLPFAYGLGLAALILDRDFRRLGDLAAGTLVVYKDQVAVEAEGAPVPPTPPPVRLHLEEQRTILAFSSRAGTWTPQRGAELAALMRPISGSGDVDTLHGWAAWLRGRR